MQRGYTFLERRRSGLDFWALDHSLDRIADRRPELGLKAHYSIYGKFDILLVIERDSVSDVHNSILELYTEAQEAGTHLISDSTTFLAVDAQPVAAWPELATVVAIDTRLSYERLVRDKLRMDTHRVIVSDMVLGDHDVITLVKSELGPKEYLNLISGIVGKHDSHKIDGIERTRTMFCIPRSA